MYIKVDFSELKGKTIISIEGLEIDSAKVTFNCSDGSQYTMLHEQDCCEYVRILDICGDISDLLNSEILLAKEKTDNKEELVKSYKYEDESHCWTFYTLATIKGYVDIRWLGESNGYYSEEVSIFRTK